MASQECVAVLQASRELALSHLGLLTIHGMTDGAAETRELIQRLTAAIDALQRQGEVRLWDSQWVNVVNHDNCYACYTTEEAVAKAVRLTEQFMRENITSGFPPQPRPAGEQTP